MPIHIAERRCLQLSRTGPTNATRGAQRSIDITGALPMAAGGVLQRQFDVR